MAGCKGESDVMGAWAHYQAGTSDTLQQDTAPLAHACQGVLLPGDVSPIKMHFAGSGKGFCPTDVLLMEPALPRSLCRWAAALLIMQCCRELGGCRGELGSP